jgi:transcriptional regulator with XRE-family HTH domain
MSQGNLADKLDVSRQTISKWENNMCLPEAEKLLQLSEIFGVSTDYILKGKTEAQTAPEPVYIYVKDPDGVNAPKHNEIFFRKYVGIVIAIIGVLLSVILVLMGGWVLIFVTAALILLGILLACNIKHPWLIFSWIVYIPTVIAMPFISMLNPLAIFHPELYTSHLPVVLYAYATWIILGLLIYFTIKAKRGYVFKKKQ